MGKHIIWLHGEIKSPPFSVEARIEAGVLLRKVQEGESLSMPASRPMPDIGKRCHELRVNDGNVERRIVYRIDDDAVVVADVFVKKTQVTPSNVIKRCIARLQLYDAFRAEN